MRISAFACKMANKLLEERKKQSLERLEEFKKRVAKIEALKDAPGLSIYVTGSYGRLEASVRSDLDLFFITAAKQPVNRITKTLIDAELIKIAKDMRFPDFSGDGKYLVIHSLSEMLEMLGSPEDDFRNFFTARLLLLLESRPIHDETAYKSILGEIIKSYFRDYHDHTEDFHPMFLVNDILRFWKTLCLNYENNRNRPPTDLAEKNKSHSANLKLKFSRLSICFSTIIPLAVMNTVSPEEILELTSFPPLERLGRIVKNTGRGKEIYDELLTTYEKFMEIAATPDLNDWIGDPTHRREAFREAEKFGALMFSLLAELVDKRDKLRFLII